MRDIAKHITIVGWLHVALNLISIGLAIYFGVNFKATYLPITIVIFSIPGIIAGVVLIKCRPWARRFAIVMSIFNLVTFPHGTVIDVYSMIILFGREAVQILGGNGERVALE